MDCFRERIELARKYLPEFGVAAYCGFGRLSPDPMLEILNEHLQSPLGASGLTPTPDVPPTRSADCGFGPGAVLLHYDTLSLYCGA